MVVAAVLWASQGSPRSQKHKKSPVGGGWQSDLWWENPEEIGIEKWYIQASFYNPVRPDIWEIWLGGTKQLLNMLHEKQVKITGLDFWNTREERIVPIQVGPCLCVLWFSLRNQSVLYFLFICLLFIYLFVLYFFNVFEVLYLELWNYFGNNYFASWNMEKMYGWQEKREE